MADLSPLAQAVADAYDDTPELPTGNHRYRWLAAALRAAADQVVPLANYSQESAWQVGFADRDAQLRRELLAIAAELEGHHG